MDMNVSHSDAIGIQCDRMIKHGSADIKTRFFFQSPPSYCISICLPPYFI